jgi:hypothetical protein
VGNRNDMPKPEEIVDYWAERLIEMDIEELAVTGGSCFVCGAVSRLERAHILALTEGGTNGLENIHLLCRQCHDESELLSGAAYWRWYIEKRCAAFIHPLRRLNMKYNSVVVPYICMEEATAEFDKLSNNYSRFKYVWSLIDSCYNKMKAETGLCVGECSGVAETKLDKIYSRIYQGL